MYYPSTLRTCLSQTRQDSRTFCQRLARNLAHCDLHPEVWHGTVYKGKKPPPYLPLPAELRQAILLLVIDDDELLRCPRPNSSTLAFTLVDKTSALDVRECMHLWDGREREVSEMRKQRKDPVREGFTCLAEDLMETVRSYGALRVLLRSSCVKREARLRQKMIWRKEAWMAEQRGGLAGGFDSSGPDDGGGDEGAELGGGEVAVEEEELSKVERRKERIKRRQAERELLAMKKCAWLERSRRQWENENPEDAKLAKLRASYSRGRPLAARGFEEL